MLEDISILREVTFSFKLFSGLLRNFSQHDHHLIVLEMRQLHQLVQLVEGFCIFYKSKSMAHIRFHTCINETTKIPPLTYQESFSSILLACQIDSNHKGGDRKVEENLILQILISANPAQGMFKSISETILNCILTDCRKQTKNAVENVS